MKDIPLFSKYKISKKGEVYNKKTGRLMKTKVNPKGYPALGLVGDNGKQRKISIHRALALAYLPNPENKPCVNHIDGIKTNNSLGNLEWCTHLENTLHSLYVIKTGHMGQKNNFCSTPERDARIILRLSNLIPRKELAELMGTTLAVVEKIQRRETWKHL